MALNDVINYWDGLSSSEDLYSLIRTDWTKTDFETRTDETVLNLFDFNFSKHDVYADLGCGVGYTVKIVAPFVKKYIGIDSGKDLIKLCEEKYPLSNVEFLFCDGKSIPLSDKSVDALTSEAVFQHILESVDGVEVCEQYFKEISRVLKSNGRLCIQLPKRSAYPYGLTRDFLLQFFDRSQILDIDNWYFHVVKNIKRNNQKMWLNSGKFKKRDLARFGDKYVSYE